MSRITEDRTEASDEMLMVRYQRGDREAFAALVSRHSACVFSLAFYLFGNEVAAEQVARETFHYLASDAATFHLEAQFHTWLFGKVHSIIVQQNHAESARETDADTDWPQSYSRLDALQVETSSPPSSRAYRSQLLLRRVTGRVAQLPLDMREAFLFKQIGQLSIVAIADAMCLDSDTVRQLIRTAFDRLQEGVADTEEYARALR
jgi:RNA polymerase sigma-70 factor (ECF subfamily)